MTARIFSASLALLALFAATDSKAVEPATLQLLNQPEALEPVHVRARLPICSQITGLSFVGGRFELATAAKACIPQPTLVDHEITLGRLPQGHYTLRVVGDAAPQGAPLELAVDVAAARAIDPESDVDGLTDFSGIWSAPSRNGDSIFVQHETGSERLLITWNTYGSDGTPIWHAAISTNTRLDDTYELFVFRTSRQGLEIEGTASFVAHGIENATFTVTMDHESPIEMALHRFHFDPPRSNVP